MQNPSFYIKCTIHHFPDTKLLGRPAAVQFQPVEAEVLYCIGVAGGRPHRLKPALLATVAGVEVPAAADALGLSVSVHRRHVGEPVGADQGLAAGVVEGFVDALPAVLPRIVEADAIVTLREEQAGRGDSSAAA